MQYSSTINVGDKVIFVRHLDWDDDLVVGDVYEITATNAYGLQVKGHGYWVEWGSFQPVQPPPRPLPCFFD